AYTYTFFLPPGFGGPATLTWSAASADYGPVEAVSSGLAALGAVTEVDPSLQGVIVPDKTTRVADITDGTSSTILTAEINDRPTVYRFGQPVVAPTPVAQNYWSGAGGWNDATSGNFTLYGEPAGGGPASTGVPVLVPSFPSPGSCMINCSNEYGLYS